MITWAVDERLCVSCGGNITDKQMGSIAYWKADPAADRWAVSHGLGECAGAAPPSSQAFGQANEQKVEPTGQQAAKTEEKAKAIAQAEALMAMAMEATAEAKAHAKALRKAEKAEQAMMGPMPMSPAETAMAAAKSMMKQSRKMMAAAKKL